LDWKDKCGEPPVEDQAMNSYMTQQALSVGVQARDQRSLDSLRAPRHVNGSARRAVGATLVAIGQRVSGEMPAQRTSQPDGDCA
jgi:hypothetical protein